MSPTQTRSRSGASSTENFRSRWLAAIGFWRAESVVQTRRRFAQARRQLVLALRRSTAVCWCRIPCAHNFWCTLGLPHHSQLFRKAARTSLPGGLPPLRPALLGRIVAGAADSQHPAHQRNAELPPMGSDAGVLHRDSLAKYVAAFYRNATSWRATSSPRRSRRISVSWAGGCPWPGNMSDGASPTRPSA